jgi:transcription initiation factor TFIIIB Brf1 subunit/transcription initiation factor TFIIB
MIGQAGRVAFGVRHLRGAITMPDSLASQIETMASTAISTNVDGQQVTERSLTELIAADEYLAARAARADATLGIRLMNFNPPGPLGNHR